MWHLKRGSARVRIDKLDEAVADLKIARGDDAPRWIRGRATVEFGKIADLRGNRDAARASYKQAMALCESDRDPLCADEARGLERNAYKGR